MRPISLASALIFTSLSGCALLLNLEDGYRDDRGVDGGDANANATPDVRESSTEDGPIAPDARPDAPADASTDVIDDRTASDAKADAPIEGGVATSIAGVAGLSAWFSADVGVAINGLEITSWTSHGGAAVVATPTSAAAKPSVSAINGRAAVHFEGMLGSASCPCPGFTAELGADLPQPVTLVAVVNNSRWTDATYNYYPTLLANPGVPYAKFHGHVVNGPAPTWALTSGASMIATNPFGGNDFRAEHQIVAVLGGASSLIRIDGAERATGGVVGGNFRKGFSIGSEVGGSPLTSFQGELAELAIFGRALTAVEMTAVEASFRTKYATP